MEMILHLHLKHRASPMWRKPTEHCTDQADAALLFCLHRSEWRFSHCRENSWSSSVSRNVSELFPEFNFFNVSLKLFYLPLNHCEKINKWELEALFMNSLDPALVQCCCWISLNLIHVPPTEIHMRAMSFIIAPSRERVQSNFPVDITL